MTVSIVPIIVASNAGTTAAIVAAEARRDRQQCIATMPTYRADTATVEQQQGYARCVERLHPSEGAPLALVLFGVFVLAACTTWMVTMLLDVAFDFRFDYVDRGMKLGAILLLLSPVAAAIGWALS